MGGKLREGERQFRVVEVRTDIPSLWCGRLGWRISFPTGESAWLKPKGPEVCPRGVSDSDDPMCHCSVRVGSGT